MNYGKNEVEKTLCKTNSRAQKITSHLVLLLTRIRMIFDGPVWNTRFTISLRATARRTCSRS